MKRLKLFRGRLQVYLEPRDVWVGVYVSRDAVYVCPLPLLVFRWTRRHRWLLDRLTDELIGGIETAPPQPPKPFDLSAIPVIASDAVPDGQVYVFSPRAWIERAHRLGEPPPSSAVRIDVEGGPS